MTQGNPDTNRRALESERAFAAKYEAYLVAQSDDVHREIAALEARASQIASDLATYRSMRKQVGL